jgi:ABC-type phosphate transport system substrate-binding protein
VLGVGLAFSLASAVAVADVVVVVSAKSTTAALSKTQVTDIFLGRVSHFPDGKRAVPIDQVAGSAAREQFYTRLAGRTPAQMKAYWSKIIFTGRGQPPTEVSDGAELKKRLAANADAIGYIDASLVDDSVRVLP